MDFKLIHQVLLLLKDFEESNGQNPTNDIDDFKRWVSDHYLQKISATQPDWEFKEKGRTANSVINTLFVHMNRYAKNYSKAVMCGSDFISQEDFIYLINLKAFGQMTKMDLIKKNVHDKSFGMLTINRLIDNDWVSQTSSSIDKRNKLIHINEKGMYVLEEHMSKIRTATEIVVGNLNESEKMNLIQLLMKLDAFHKPIYEKNFETEHLLNQAYQYLNK